MPTFTANKSGITFTRAATDVDMKLSTTDAALWGITNFTVTFKGVTTYSYDESSTSSGAKDYQTINQESKTSGTTTTFKFTFKNVTINETAKNLYYFKFKADDVRFPDYQIDEWTGTPVVYGMTTYKLNDYWIYSPQKEQSGVPSIVPYPLDGALLQWIYTELLAEEAKLILMILHGIILASTVISNRFLHHQQI